MSDGPARATNRCYAANDALRHARRQQAAPPQVNCGWGAMRTGLPNAADSAAPMPGTRATPPVKRIGSASVPARHGGDPRGHRRLHARENVLRQHARGQQPDDLGLGKDDAHAADGGRARLRGASPPSAASWRPICAASISRNRPLPAAQRSFITKSATPPLALQADQLAVLAADVDDRAGVGRRGGGRPRPGR